MRRKLKVFSFYQPTLRVKGRPREDFVAFDSGAGVCAVADGVSLWEDLEYVGEYPRTSGAYRIARVFCQTFVKYLVRRPRATLEQAFVVGNRAAARINRGRSKYDVFRRHKNLFAATAAMTRVCGNILEWARICDSGVAVLGASGELKFGSDDCSHHFEWPADSDLYDPTSATFFARTLVRNAVGAGRRLRGYGVVTGEPAAELYLETGRLRLLRGDTVLLYTDGFKPCLGDRKFRKIVAAAASEQGLRRGLSALIREKTAWLMGRLRGHRIDGRASVETIEAKLKRILGRRLPEVGWAKEKSLLVVKPF